MRKRILHTSINLLIEPEMYQRLKLSASVKKTPMSKIIRDGINLILNKIDKENNAVMGGQE
ncbi:MAG: transcriptional regulator [Desulfobacteraceae bacterium]|nr:MAG: transcriptional regulator [Desulfobacteraceae bacterium]